MPDEETRDVYRIKLLEGGLEKADERLDAIEARQQSTDEWKGRQEEQARDDREDAKRRADQLRTGIISLAVSITAAVVIALISTGHL